MTVLNDTESLYLYVNDGVSMTVCNDTESL